MKRKIGSGIEYKVDKKEAAPIISKHRDKRRFPFGSMNIGESFFIPEKEQHPNAARTSLGTAIRTFNLFNKKSYKITTRVVEGGLRVWRIE